MSLLSLTGVISYLRRLRPGEEANEDSELLARFAAGDGGALEALVRRHAPLVWGVCRRRLTRDADAEDAFQATFLVLVRKARSLANGRPLGPWLHTVAARTAAKARAAAMRRAAREGAAVEAAAPPGDDPAQREARAVVDEEVGRLPARYREAVVLCYLEGRTNEEAAKHLGCPKGTILSRLARARDRLRRRLERRGLGPCLVPLGELVAPGEVPVSALAGAGRAGAASGGALALAEGVLSSMSLHQLKWVGVACLVLVLAAGGAGWLARAAEATPKGDPVTQRQEGKAPAVAAERPGKADKEPVEKPAADRKAPANFERTFELRDILAKTIDCAGYDDPKSTLQEVLEQLGKIHRITFDVNEKAFKAEKVKEVLKFEVANPPIPPMKTSLGAVLRKVIERIPDVQATFLIRKDVIEITTEKALRAELGAPKQQPGGPQLTLVWHDFRKVSVQTALQDIADATGESIVLDPRAEKQAAAVITARLLNVSVESAVDVLSDMAGLEVVRVESVYYVTTPDNAQRLRNKRSPQPLKAKPARPEPGK
jgi:RNA polymerase sigma factor (sigma-70 family)